MTDLHALGYGRVDLSPNSDVLISAMNKTAQWDATMRLREWERRSLRLSAGEQLLDVGCGLGDAALELGKDLGPHGSILGIDLSEQMLQVARSNAATALCSARFEFGDASALEQANNSFDAVRSERTLQWLPDPAQAVAEMVRVLRPGGRVSLIDTDWSTFTLNIADDALSSLVHEAMRVERSRPSNVGRRLAALMTTAGCQPVASTEATQTWTAWDPDRSPAPSGCFSMKSLVDDLVTDGILTNEDGQRRLEQIEDAARHGNFSMSLTMYGVVGVAEKKSHQTR